MTAPEPSADVQPDEVERVAVALAEAMDDGCFDRSMYTEAEWENGDGEEYREDYRRYARAAVAARPSADTETLRRVLDDLEAEESDPDVPTSAERRAGWHAALSAVRAALDGGR